MSQPNQWAYSGIAGHLAYQPEVVLLLVAHSPGSKSKEQNQNILLKSQMLFLNIIHTYIMLSNILIIICLFSVCNNVPL